MVAVSLRVTFTVAYRGGLDRPPDSKANGADGTEYDLIGRRLAAGDGYTWESGASTAFRAPGLPLLLAAVYSAFGPHYPAAYLALAVCGGVGAVVSALLAGELFGRCHAWWAGLVAAVHPGDVFFCSYFFSEAVYAPVLGVGLIGVTRAANGGRLGWAAVGGLFLGYATLCRSFGLLFVPLFGLFLLVRLPTRRGVLAAGLFGLGFAAVLGPWVGRNYQAFGKPVLVATNGGSTFYGGNNPVVAGSLAQYGNWVATTRLPGRDLIDAQPDEVSHDKMEWQLGMAWVREHPGQFLKLVPFKLARFWAPFGVLP